MRAWLALLVCAACAADSGAPRIVPQALQVSVLPGGSGGLEVVALTLQTGATHPELYAAVRNAGDAPACGAALSVELFDARHASLAAAISGVFAPRFYRRTDGSTAIAGCVGPGDVSMAALTDLPAELAIEDVSALVYRCPYFALDVEPVEGLSVRGLRRAGVMYRGAVFNGFDRSIQAPAVHVFAVEGSGRPVGVVMRRAEEVVLAPGEAWAFEVPLVAAGDAVGFAEGEL